MCKIITLPTQQISASARRAPRRSIIAFFPCTAGWKQGSSRGFIDFSPSYQAPPPYPPALVFSSSYSPGAGLHPAFFLFFTSSNTSTSNQGLLFRLGSLPTSCWRSQPKAHFTTLSRCLERRFRSLPFNGGFSPPQNSTIHSNLPIRDRPCVSDNLYTDHQCPRALCNT